MTPAEHAKAEAATCPLCHVPLLTGGAVTDIQHPANACRLSRVWLRPAQWEGLDDSQPAGGEERAAFGKLHALQHAGPVLVKPRGGASIVQWAADEIEASRPAVLADHRAVMANVRLGKWMSAALDDPKVCEEMKADIREWFSAGHPPHALSRTQARG